MGHVGEPEREEDPDRQRAIRAIRMAAQNGELVIVTGAGLSVGLTRRAPQKALLWKALIQNGIEYCRDHKVAALQEIERLLRNLDAPGAHLEVATTVQRLLKRRDGVLFRAWLRTLFDELTPEDEPLKEAVRTIQRAGIPLCTLNYDNLLEHITGLSSITFSGQPPRRIGDWLRRTGSSQGVLHLHGHYHEADSVVFDITNYTRIEVDTFRKDVQKILAFNRLLLFVGTAGTFSDPNFTELIHWSRGLGDAATMHYALVKNYDVDVYRGDEAWHGFVHPVGFGERHDSDELARFLLSLFSDLSLDQASVSIPPPEPPRRAQLQPQDESLLERYRTYVVHQYQTWNFEGFEGQAFARRSRFRSDVKDIYVPPDVVDYPAESDEKNRISIGLGQALEACQRLILVGLPGSGKSMVLKRLAVDYADPSRQLIVEERTPEEDRIPVLVPLRGLTPSRNGSLVDVLRHFLDNLEARTMRGLFDAISRHFDDGRLLLLFDALDLLNGKEDRQLFAEQLDEFVRDHASVRIVVTTRQAQYDEVALGFRYFKPFQLATLSDEAIGKLCARWRRRQGGTEEEIAQDASQLALTIRENISLRRLAETPLLLTMLLLVWQPDKPDIGSNRVGLYDRAVRVLLEGGAPQRPSLDRKEVMPQLTCLAFDLMKTRRLGGTEAQLVELLDGARGALQQARFPTEPNSTEFIRKVVSRTSLLREQIEYEAGETIEYQFPHETFQSFFAAEAAANRCLSEYAPDADLFTVLAHYLSEDAWRDVIAMAAVLADGKAEPLIGALVSVGQALQRRASRNEDFEGMSAWLASPARMPAPVELLTQCLIDGATALDHTIDAALGLIVFFARGCRSDYDWQALARGDYGERLLDAAWTQYQGSHWKRESLIAHAIDTCMSIAVYRKPMDHWKGEEGAKEIADLLGADQAERSLAIGLLICAGVLSIEWYESDPARKRVFAQSLPLTRIEALLKHESYAVSHAAIWAWGLIQSHDRTIATRTALLNHLKNAALSNIHGNYAQVARWALLQKAAMPRSKWTPKLTKAQQRLVKDMANINTAHRDSAEDRTRVTAALLIAFYAGGIWKDGELATRFAIASEALNFASDWRVLVDQILRQLKP
ncbi:hypothetical protein CBA19CS22_06480 [Caballeronia novacaledonica]|uniref:Uncharacterized protein n=1 Tax=Caballeronia novacaledonica TaxID=1544861 RepID=A0ACB5QLT7_9BURK|nr:hypothetical protein CBA19CS22_06480 [Caballeronia novacaledonica]